MPVDYSATIILDRDQKQAMIELSYAQSFAAVQTFAGVLHTLTTADIVRVTFTEAVDPQLTGTGAEIADPSFAVMFKLRRTDPNADIRFKNFRLPAPKMEIFDHLPQVGYRVKKTYGDTIAAAYSALTGESFIFDSGWMVN